MRTSLKKKLIAFLVLALAQWAVLAHALTLPGQYHAPAIATRPVFAAVLNSPWVFGQPYYYGQPAYVYPNIYYSNYSNTVSVGATVQTNIAAPFLYIQTGYRY